MCHVECRDALSKASFSGALCYMSRNFNFIIFQEVCLGGMCLGLSQRCGRRMGRKRIEETEVDVFKLARPYMAVFQR